MIRAVIFDYDGVIADSLQAVVRTNNQIMKRFGHAEVSLADFRNGSMDWKETYRRLGFTEAQIHEAKTQFYSTINELHEEIAIFDGIEHVLAKLHARHKIGLVTNSYREVIENKMGKAALLRYVDCIVDAENGKLKPDPEPVLLCLKRLGVQPSEAAMVGDTYDDIRAARGAGLSKVIAVSYGYHAVHRLGDADMIVHSPAEILEALA